jgi:DnaA family protein
MSASSPRQLPLAIKLDDSATFSNFHVAAGDRQLIDYLTSRAGLQQFTYLWGSEGAGRSHLLQALCHQADTALESAFYIPLKNHHEYSPDIFEDLESLALICLDDVQVLAGNHEWELALFSLFNRLRDTGTRLVIASDVSPRQLQVQLPDLLSRLQSGVVFQMQALEDADKLLALQLRARQRGFELSDEVAFYVLQRNERSMRGLFELLECLDQHSLETKRRITVPMVRELMGWHSGRIQSDVL